jgi:EF-P beta-lysylation protein EpmB
MKTLPLWRQIQRKNFVQISLLADYLEISSDRQEKLLSYPRFSLNLPLRLASKINKNDLNDPILRQFIPLNEETSTTPGFVADPVQDLSFRKTKKLLHKYSGRALLITTSACAMHCRFCFRQNFPYETEVYGFDEEITYLKQNPSLQEIILSGGDPLSLSDDTLMSLFEDLNSISHLRRIRFHTRFPIGIPERIDSSFLNLLASSKKQIFFVIHCNHPKELDDDVIHALKKIQCLGIPVLNQSVLLKGVNDDEKTLLDLSESLTNAGIVPYYLHQLDPVTGTGHFTIPNSRSSELLKHLQKSTSGYGVPRLVREEPGLSSKTWVF